MIHQTFKGGDMPEETITLTRAELEKMMRDFSATTINEACAKVLEGFVSVVMAMTITDTDATGRAVFESTTKKIANEAMKMVKQLREKNTIAEGIRSGS